MKFSIILLVHLVILKCSVLASTHCKYSTRLKLAQVLCSNLNTSTEKEISIKHSAEKLIFRNVTGPLDLSNFTLDHLKQLVISHSQVDYISFGQFPELLFLTILKNQFPNLTKHIFEPVTHINWLSLVSNNHTIAQDAFHFLTNLTWIHIQNQKLEHLTGEFFKKSTNLHELALRNCHLAKIDSNAFDQTINLEILSMNFNQIARVEAGTFKNLKKLKILELHHNRFLDLNLQQFQGVISLEVLGLPSNVLRSANSTQLLAAFPNLKKLEVKRSDLKRGENVKLVWKLRKEGVDIIGTPHECHGLLTHCNIA